MTADALAVVQTLFSVIWQLFTGWYIPGTHVTPAGFFMFLAAAGLSLKLIARLFEMGASTDTSHEKKSKGD